MIEHLSQEKQESWWWSAWRKADYSWDGLLERRWVGWSVIEATGAVVETATLEASPGAPPPPAPPLGGQARPATLQDYWRLDFTSMRVRSDAEMAGELVRAEGQPIYHIAHLPAVYATGAPAKASWSDAQKAALDELLSARLERGIETRCSGSSFTRKIVGADRRAHFRGVVLFGVPSRRHAERALAVRFDQACFLEAARFEGAHFSGEASFDGAMFVGAVSLGDARFSGFALFDSVTFLGEVSAHGATFLEGASFLNAEFFKDVRCDSATFAEDANFMGVGFLQSARFAGVRFAKSASFFQTDFNSAIFDKATFSGSAGFFTTTFSRKASFDGAVFSWVATFDNAQFNGELAFLHAVISGPAFFRKVVFPDRAAHFSAAFRGARFVDVADFSGSGTRMIAAFDEAIFEKKLLLDDSAERTVNKEFDRVILRDLPGSAKLLVSAEARRSEEHERLLKELEGGCRAVKVAMGRERDEVLEQRYYRFQLMARRRQRGTPWFEKFYSWLYGAFSDYGLGLWQPFLSLAVLLAFFAGGYWAWAETLRGWPDRAWTLSLARPFDQDAWDALLFSANNAFRPLSVWSTEAAQSQWMADFVNAYGRANEGGQRLAIRLVATLQSVLSVVLFFLFALAVRRRFQIGT